MLKKKLKQYNISMFSFICIVIFLIALILGIAFRGKVSNSSVFKWEVNKEYIDSYFDKITNNYSLKVSYNDTTVNYDTDGKATIYSYDTNDDGFIIYNNNLYHISYSNEKYKSEKLDYVMDSKYPYYDLDFLKTIIVKYCTYRHEGSNSVSCSMKSEDYFNEYNAKYNTSYVLSNDYVYFTIKYNNKIISNINIDYTNVNKVISGGVSKLIFDIKISKLNTNNFDSIIDGLGI